MGAFWTPFRVPRTHQKYWGQIRIFPEKRIFHPWRARQVKKCTLPASQRVSTRPISCLSFKPAQKIWPQILPSTNFACPSKREPQIVNVENTTATPWVRVPGGSTAVNRARELYPPPNRPTAGPSNRRKTGVRFNRMWLNRRHPQPPRCASCGSTAYGLRWLPVPESCTDQPQLPVRGSLPAICHHNAPTSVAP